MKPMISVMIFTLNEEIHLPVCLAYLQWCDDIIVIDSFSTDGTEEICRLSETRFFQHRFEGFGKQRNWAIQNTHPKYDWILILDADERVPPMLACEINNTIQNAPDNVGAYCLKRRFYMWGKWLRYSSLYPSRVVRLIHKNKVRYINRGHAETQEVNGKVLELKHDLIDENLKGIDEWFARQNRYSAEEAKYELSDEALLYNGTELFSRDPLMRRAAFKSLAKHIPGRPLWYFFYRYIFRMGFLDGRDGFVFCIMKTIYQAMIMTKKYDMRRGLIP